MVHGFLLLRDHVNQHFSEYVATDLLYGDGTIAELWIWRPHRSCLYYGDELSSVHRMRRKANNQEHKAWCKKRMILPAEIT
jgi:hypothetical protein